MQRTRERRDIAGAVAHLPREDAPLLVVVREALRRLAAQERPVARGEKVAHVARLRADEAPHAAAPGLALVLNLRVVAAWEGGCVNVRLLLVLHLRPVSGGDGALEEPGRLSLDGRLARVAAANEGERGRRQRLRNVPECHERGDERV